MVFQSIQIIDRVLVDESNIVIFKAFFNNPNCTGNNRNEVYNVGKTYFNIISIKTVNGITFIKDSFDVKPFTIVNENKIAVKIQIRLDQNFTKDLSDKSSNQYKELESTITISLTSIYQKIPGFVAVIIIKFTSGSIITDYEVVLDNQINQGTDASIENEIQKVNQLELNKPGAKIGNIPVVSGSIKVKDVNNPKNSETSTSSSLATWIIVLIASCCIVFFLVIIIIHQRVSCWIKLLKLNPSINIFHSSCYYKLISIMYININIRFLN